MSNAKFSVGQQCWVRIYSSGRTEVYFVEIIELCGVAAARVQIIGGGILRVFQSQLCVNPV